MISCHELSFYGVLGEAGGRVMIEEGFGELREAHLAVLEGLDQKECEKLALVHAVQSSL